MIRNNVKLLSEDDYKKLTDKYIFEIYIKHSTVFNQNQCIFRKFKALTAFI